MMIASTAFSKFNQILSRTQGFVREELLLGSLVVGGLGTFGAVVGVPWQSIFADTVTQTAELARQVESANLKFYQEYGYWPHEVTDGSPAANILVLVDRQAATDVYISPNRFKPLLEADIEQRDGASVVRHRMGKDGVVREVALSAGEDDNYRYAVTFDNLSLEKARMLDQTIDGEFNPESGRLRVAYNGNTAVARYLANPRLDAVAADSRSDTFQTN